MNIYFVIGAVGIGAVLLYASPAGAEIEVAVSNAFGNKNWEKFDPLFKKYGARYNVPWTWLKAIALNESSLGTERSVARGIENPNDVEGSKSYDGLSWGLMQVTLTTAREMDPTATQQKLNNPEYSIDLAARYLSKLATMFSRVDARFTEWVIKSYNQGPGNSRKERDGKSNGFAHEYWARFQRNLEKVEATV